MPLRDGEKERSGEQASEVALKVGGLEERIEQLQRENEELREAVMELEWGFEALAETVGENWYAREGADPDSAPPAVTLESDKTLGEVG